MTKVEQIKRYIWFSLGSFVLDTHNPYYLTSLSIVSTFNLRIYKKPNWYCIKIKLICKLTNDQELISISTRVPTSGYNLNTYIMTWPVPWIIWLFFIRIRSERFWKRPGTLYTEVKNGKGGLSMILFNLIKKNWLYDF